MLTKHDIEALLVWRIWKCSQSCNSAHISQVIGQIEGLAAVLRDGVPCRADDIGAILAHVGIPFMQPDIGKIEFDGPWMADHGFVLDEKTDTYSHPRFDGMGW